MKVYCLKLIFLISVIIFLCGIVSAQTVFNRRNLFDFNWKFHRGGAQGAEAVSLDDTGWRNVDLPHDWSIENLPGTDSPFNINAISQVSGGFTTGGTGWYRKKFTVPRNLTGKQVIIMFEGVYMNADVWLNGKLLGNHPYGYTSFWFDITSGINYDKENVLAVKVINEGENSRWYSGSGIYRHVWLDILPEVNVGTWGISVSTPEITPGEAKTVIKTTIININKQKSSDIKLVTRIFNSSGQISAEMSSDKIIEPGGTIKIEQQLKIKNPELWSNDTPVLYKAESEVYESGNSIDKTETEFGIRSISFDAVNGFLLNGKPVKLKGGCIHHDNGILGSRAYDRAEERRIEILKRSGFNAVRCSHNPPSPAFLNACDHRGMLVIDEAFDMWNDEKNPNDYHLYFSNWWKRDIESMVLRDRNHPSVILWSIGNEIPDRTNPEVIQTAGALADFIRTLDKGRPVTSAVNDLSPDKDPYFSALDVGGYNYAAGGDHNQKDLYETDHARVPERIMVGTESFPLEAFDSWRGVTDHPYVIGDFVWTAWDYIGEASIGWRGYYQKQNFYPWNLAYCGDIDICGWKRPQSYYRDALWKENQLSVWVTPPKPSFDPNPERESWSKWHWLDASDNWNWDGDEGKIMNVEVYSSCEIVELFLNDKSLGKKTTDRSSQYIARWQVPYAKGKLVAVGFSGKKQVAVAGLQTSGEATRMKLTADRSKIKSDGQDLSYVTVELTDSLGIFSRVAENMLSFEISGPGSIVGTGNANPVSLESFQLPQRHAWHGRCLVVVKSGKVAGKITLTVKSAGIRTDSIDIESI